MLEILVLALKTELVPAGVSPGPEEICPHVVVEPGHLPALVAKMHDDLAADKTVGPGHK